MKYIPTIRFMARIMTGMTAKYVVNDIIGTINRYLCKGTDP